MEDQARGLRQLAAKYNSKARTIVITSGKGGVGKTSLAVNLAIALSQRGKQVAILDGDLGLANADLLMGVRAPYNIKHLVDGQKRVSEIIVHCPKGVKLIPGGSGIPEITNMSEIRVKGLIEALGVLDQYVDFLIIDTGAGISKQVLAFALAADEVLVVTTPEPTSLADAYGIIKVVNNGNPQMPINIVVNQADGIEDGKRVFERLDIICQRFINKKIGLAGIVPFDYNVSKAIRSQEPIIIGQPTSKAALAINKIAADYLDTLEKVEIKTNQSQNSKGFKGLLERMARLLR